MKKLLIVLLALTGVAFSASAKEKRITVTPAEAKIYIDGNYVGDGSYSVKFRSKDDFFQIKLEYPGYVTMEVKVFRNDTRNVIPFALKEDDSLEGSVASNLANQFFTINVRDGVDEDQAWKLITQVLLNYFDEIKTSDKASGFMNTAWSVQSFPMSELKVRTRVQIKEITNEGLAYQIRVSTEVAPLNSGEQAYKPWPRVLKKFEPLISEMQQRVGQ